MSVLELKGEMHQLITQVQSPTSAQQLLELIRDFLDMQPELEDENGDFEYHMSDEQKASMQEGLDRSYDSKNLIPQVEAKKLL